MRFARSLFVMSPILPVAALLVGAGIVPPPSAAPPIRPQNPDAQQVLAQAANRHRSMDSFCAHFTQRLTVPLLGQATESRGELCHKKPGYFSMRFFEPAGDEVVADGEYVWAYFPSTDPAVVFRMRPGPGGGSLDFHREFLEDPGSRYQASYDRASSLNGRAAHVLTLTPRVTSEYRWARVWIDARDFTLRRIEIQEKNDSTREVDLRDLRVDAAPAEEAFRFIPPPGAQIIQR